jgi:hypothetical protein
VKPENDDPPAHVHEWVTETYYTTEIETRTETETQYVTVQEVIDHPEVSHEETKYFVEFPDGRISGPFDSFLDADMLVQSNLAIAARAYEDTVTVVDTQAWQETVNRSVPQEVQVTRDYEVQVPHERTYCKTCGEEQN